MPPQPDPTMAQKIETLKQERPKKTRAEIGAILDICVSTVRNYTSDKWLSERGLSRFLDGSQGLQEPCSAVEKEAWSLCQNEDHKWLQVALYEGHAFRVTEEIREQPGHTGSTVGTIYKVNTCNFCGLSREERTSGYIVV